MRIGIDLGGHTLTAALVSEPDGELLPRVERIKTRNTPPGRGVREVMQAMADVVESLADGSGDVISIGVAVPGALDAARRRSLRLSNFPKEWDDLDLLRTFGDVLKARRISAQIYIENDANCYALGEWRAGEAIGVSDFVVFTMGTGIGCGIITGGELLTGAHGMAAEGGHLVIGGDIPCGCGGRGHAETLAAADGTAARAAAKGIPADFGELWAMRGSADADEVLETTLDAMARTIASVCHLLDPELVIIGGGMSQADGIGKALYERTLPYMSYPFKGLLDLRISKLGNEAPLYGAAGMGHIA
ncbi:MAG: ROK family protein [Synergistaceae bacterium]|jgi:glucokinase|nr:ROK family protein [Synergistaceae bacterium]